jgi:curved DNA-binding protein
VAVKFRDYYEILGVPRSATADDIKRAYRQLARKHHPDLQPAHERTDAAERFKEINEANEVLSDPDKRRRYDALGANWKSGADFTPPGAGRRAPDTSQWEDIGDFSDFFASIFGRRAPGASAGEDRPGGARFSMPGSDVEAELPVTLDDALRGGRRRLTLGERSIDVEIPPGVRDGTVLRLAGQGQPGIGDGPPGDLYLRARLLPHPRYRVVGDDLEMDLPLQPWQALLGDAVKVETPDGTVTLKVPAGTQSGRRLRLRARGLPRAKGGGRGDLFGVARIVIPERPTAEERAAYESLKAMAAATTGQSA